MKRFIYSAFLVLSAFALITGCSDSKTDEPKPDLTVTFDSQGGSAVTSITVEQGSKISKPTNPTKEGFLFVDWFKDQAGTTAWNFETDAVESNITLYAKWTTDTFTVTFNTNGGTAIAPIEVASGAKATKPTNPTKEGYTFENWYSDATLTTTYNFTTPVTADLTLYAKWMTEGRPELEAKINEVLAMDLDIYTAESVAVVDAAMLAAGDVLANENATSAQMKAALKTLDDAIKALVTKPVYQAAKITLNTIPALLDGDILLVAQGHYPDITGYCTNAADEYIDNVLVTFTYKEADFANIAESGSFVSDDEFELYFDLKADAVPGATAQITITSQENPTLTRVVTVRVAQPLEWGQIFIDLVATLPNDPADVTFLHADIIEHAKMMMYDLPESDLADDSVFEAMMKLSACIEALQNLPARVQYSVFTGNECTLTELGASGDVSLGAFTYEANGTFPAGSYTQKKALSDGEILFTKCKYVLLADGTGEIMVKSGYTEAEVETAQWELDRTITKYTCEGTQAAGGMFYITTESNPGGLMNHAKKLIAQARQAKAHRATR